MVMNLAIGNCIKNCFLLKIKHYSKINWMTALTEEEQLKHNYNLSVEMIENISQRLETTVLEKVELDGKAVKFEEVLKAIRA